MIEDYSKKGLYVSLDVPEGNIRPLIANTSNIQGVSGYYLGAATALEMSLPLLVDNINVAHSARKAPILIYDHQAAGVDVARNAKRLMHSIQTAGVHKVVVYPSSNPEIATAWIKEGQDHQLDVIVGKELTQEAPPTDSTYDEAFRLAASLGIREFMLPGNKPDRIAHYRTVIEEVLNEKSYTIYSSGFGDQGGTVEGFAQVAGQRNGWQLVVGSDIFKSGDPRQRAEEYVAAIQKYSIPANG